MWMVNVQNVERCAHVGRLLEDAIQKPGLRAAASSSDVCNLHKIWSMFGSATLWRVRRHLLGQQAFEKGIKQHFERCTGPPQRKIRVLGRSDSEDGQNDEEEEEEEEGQEEEQPPVQKLVPARSASLLSRLSHGWRQRISKM